MKYSQISVGVGVQFGKRERSVVIELHKENWVFCGVSICQVLFHSIKQRGVKGTFREHLKWETTKNKGHVMES